MKTRALFATLFALAACHRDNVRGLDATPDVPTRIEFGMLPINQARVVPLTISNTGEVELAVRDTHVDEPFDVESPADPVPSGSSSDVLVRFEPIAPGDTIGTLTLTTSSIEMPEVTVELHGIAFDPQLDTPGRLDFGDVNVGDTKTLTFPIANSSPVALNPELDPVDDGTAFLAVPQGSLPSIDPRGTLTVSVSFSPVVAGQVSSSLALSCPVCATKQILLTGNGLGAPAPQPACALSASPASLDFGTLRAGQSASQTVTLKADAAGGPCILRRPYLVSSNDPAFGAGPLEDAKLQPGDVMSLTVTFAPTTSTTPQATGGLEVVSNDTAHSPLDVAFTGAVETPPPPPLPGKLTVAPTALSFTAQAPNAPAAQTVTVLNEGGSALTWTASTADAKLTLTPAEGSLAAGASTTVSVAVAAETAASTRDSTIRFDAGTAGQGAVTAHIVFTAAPPPPPPPANLTVTPASLSFSAEVGNTPAPQAVTVGNSGGLSLHFAASVDDTGVTLAPASGDVAGGASSVVQVAVAPSQFVGKRSATMTVDAGSAGQKTVAISIEFVAGPPPPPPPQYGDSAWPKWHHDNRSSGLSHIDTSANTGTLRWKAYVSPPVPCIQDGRTNQMKRCGTYVNSPVLTSDGSVVQLGGDGNLYEFDRATGKQKWSVQTAPPWIAANEGTPTVVKDGSIFLMTAGESSSKPQFYKVSKDGKIVWNNLPGGTCGTKKCDGWDSSPAFGDDGTLYEANDDVAWIQSYDQLGNELGHVELSPKSDLETQSAALGPDNIGYWSGNGHVWALTPQKQLWSFTDPVAAKYDDWNPAASFHNIKSSPALTPDGKVIWSYVFETTKDGVTMQTTRVYAFAAGATMKQLWVANLGPSKPKQGLPPGPGLASDYADSLHYRSGITSPAVGPDGTIYVGHCDGLFALDPATGKFKWGVGSSEVVGSPAVGKDGTIYFGSMDGNLYAVKPDGTVKWSLKTKGQLNSSPAIGADGTVYFMSDDGYLYAAR